MSPEAAQAIRDEIEAIRAELKAWAARPGKVVKIENLGPLGHVVFAVSPSYPLPGSAGDVSPRLGVWKDSWLGGGAGIVTGRAAG